MVQRKASFAGLVLAAAALVMASPLWAQDAAPTITPQPSARQVMVVGIADPGAMPVSIYDNSYDVPTLLGSSMSIDDNGNYAVVIRPPLVEGHSIYAEDAQGRQSAFSFVLPPLTGYGLAGD